MTTTRVLTLAVQRALSKYGDRPIIDIVDDDDLFYDLVNRVKVRATPVQILKVLRKLDFENDASEIAELERMFKL
jgi:hypothetical protein